MLLDAFLANLRTAPPEKETGASVARNFARRERQQETRRQLGRLVRRHPWAVVADVLLVAASVGSSCTLLLLAIASAIVGLVRAHKRKAAAVKRTDQRREAIGGEPNSRSRMQLGEAGLNWRFRLASLVGVPESAV